MTKLPGWQGLQRVALVLGLPAVLVVVWWFASADSDHLVFRPLSEILVAFRETWLGPRLVEDVLPSLSRLARGYAASVVLGVGLGVLVGWSRTLRALLEPVLELLRAIPPPALIPLIGLFAGLGDSRRIVIIIAGCVWPILLNTVEGVRAVDEVLADTCRSYRVRGLTRLRQLVLRSASPQIMTGARQALAIGIILMVISELRGTVHGIGFSVEQFQTSFRYPEMWSGVLLLGLLGVALALLFRLADSWILGWYHGLRASNRER
ncbi:MAG: ABC transporter permease subunit [Micromonosporaceae bacterium]|nr:ABC transporter permease subunit [Micromonosporaceae bacterium]